LRRLAAALAVLAGFGVSTASAELVQRGDLFVHFGGGISPVALPRDRPAPIGMRIEGTVRPAHRGDRPPALRRIVVALNRGGRLDARGLPTCPRSRVESTTPSEALTVCGAALVGTGGFTARSSFPGQPAYLLRGEILLFNGRLGGRPAIVGHLFQREPARITRIVPFSIRRSAGSFGTMISARLPAEINRNGYLRSIYLQLQRSFTVHGESRAYLSASCATPPGIRTASFPFARVSMGFEDGRSLSSTLVRSCTVRG